MIDAFVATDENGRIITTTTHEEFAGGMQAFKLPDDFNFAKQGDYVIQNGELVHDGAQTEADARRKAKAQAAHTRAEQIQAASIMFVRTNAHSLDDDAAQRVDMLFDEWTAGASYKTGDIIRYKAGLYRVLQNVPSAQADHMPDKAVSLYKKIGEPTGGLFPWSQPQGAHDAYKKGDKVSHKGKTWVSTVDNNVWEPGVYGWEEAKE